MLSYNEEWKEVNSNHGKTPMSAKGNPPLFGVGCISVVFETAVRTVPREAS